MARGGAKGVTADTEDAENELPVFLVQGVYVAFLVLPHLSPELSAVPKSTRGSPIQSPLPRPASCPTANPYADYWASTRTSAFFPTSGRQPPSVPRKGPWVR